MIRSKIHARDTVQKSVAPSKARTNVRIHSTVARRPFQVPEIIYDALDYRLMATFPASDAIAQY